MLAVLNNVLTLDEYDESTTLICQGAVKINLAVANAAIYFSYAQRTGMHPGATLGNFGAEALKLPATYLLARNVEAVRVRSAAKGVPARVTIEALGPGE